MKDLTADQVDEIARACIEDVDPAALQGSPALRRLIEDVQRDEPRATSGYNRMHNRHNRSGGPW